MTLAKDDPNSVAWQINSLTDDQGRRIDINSLATSGLGCDEVGNLKGLRTNQAFTSGSAAPQPATYQQADYTYDGDTGLAGQFTSHRWLTRLKQTFHGVTANTTTLLVQNDYTYDAAGQRLTNQLSSIDPTTGNLTSRTEAYGYDELNRLTSVDYGDGETQAYSFDSMGNRTGKSDTVSGTTSESYVVNAANMLTSRTVGGTANAYTNDADGNTLTGGGRTNTWDSENRMVSCVNGTNTSTFTYGSDGIRHSSVVNSVSTDFVLDNSMFIRELHTDPTTLLTSVKATYFMGANGPAYRRDDANGGTVRWYLYDGLGSVLGEVDPSGNITARRKYDVYGATRAGSDAGTSKHKFVGALGHPSEDETGLIYMRARYYDPLTGRFVSQDPAKNSNNWFVYCHNNPVNRLDQTGTIDFLYDILVAILAHTIADALFHMLKKGWIWIVAAWLDRKAAQLEQQALFDEAVAFAEGVSAEPLPDEIGGPLKIDSGRNAKKGIVEIFEGITLREVAELLRAAPDEFLQ